MATPTTGTVALVGGTTGMAPFPVHWYADIEGGGSTWATGSGEWPEGRWELQVIDNGTGDVYSPSLSRNAMTVTCPINGHTASAFNRIGAVGYAGAVIWDAGSYKCRLRYQNRDGDWSAWADSSTITVAADSRTVIHCRGANGSDANDGLSFENAKATANGALAAIAGDNYKVIFYDDETVSVSAGTDISAHSGVWVTRSYDGVSPPSVVLDQASGVAVTVGSDTVIDGVDFDYDDSTRQNVLYIGAGGSNIAFCDIGTGPITSLLEMSALVVPDGVLFYNCYSKPGADAQRYYVFWGAGDRLAILGCDWIGSLDEHVVRIVGGVADSTASFIAIDFTTLDYNTDATGKTALRCYAEKHVGVYRIVAKDGSMVFGSNDTHTGGTGTWSNYRIDCVRFESDPGVSATQQVVIYEGVKNIIFASCNLWRDNPSTNPLAYTDVRGGIVESIEGLAWRGCSIYTIDGNAMPMEMLAGPVADGGVYGCIVMTNESTLNVTWRSLIKGATAGNPEVQESVLFDHSSTAITVLRVDDTNYADAAAVNALTGCNGNVDGQLTIAKETGAVSGGTAHQGIVTDITGVFESLTAGTGYTTEIDRTLSAWDAGAVQRDAMLVAEPVSDTPKGNFGFWW